jgi:hypothetical protein
MNSKTLSIVSLFFLMLVTGVFWGTWFTLTRSLETFGADEFIHIGKTIIANVAWPMRFLMPGTIVLMTISLLLNRQRRDGAFFSGILSWFLIVAVLLVTLVVLVPIDNQIKSWTADTVPNNWTSLRETWNRFHTLRTFLSLCSFISFSIYLVAPGFQKVG